MFTVLATINGVEVPVSVSDEQMNAVVYETYQMHTEDEVIRANKEGYATGSRDGAVSQRRWIVETLFASVVESNDAYEGIPDNYTDEYIDFVETIIAETYGDEQGFADAIINGSLKKAIIEFLESHKSTAKYFEYEVYLTRTVTQNQTMTITVKAEDRAEADKVMDNLRYRDIEDSVDDSDWEEVDWDDHAIEDWDSTGYEYDTDEDCNCINEE